MATVEYDPTKHILLRDIAHQWCIHQDSEFKEFVNKVLVLLEEEFNITCGWFEVVLPTEVGRTPLPNIVFEPDAVQGGPTATMKWEGIQPAINRTWHTLRAAYRVGREMVPIRTTPAHRVAYAWQVKEFDPGLDVVVRYWCRSYEISVVDFWTEFYPTVLDELETYSTTNPELEQEKEKGSYSPTRRSVAKEQLFLLHNHYLGTDDGLPDPETFPEPSEVVLPQQRPVHDTEYERDREVVWNIHSTVAAYTGEEVLQALTMALGRDVRPFSGVTMDSTIMATSQENLFRYLASNPVDARQYIRDDRGGKNYDCDDFALNLRTDLIRDYGYNSCIIVGGNFHAFCAFVVVGPEGPKIVFVEPQTDGIITELSGQYAVDKRCEAIM